MRKKKQKNKIETVGAAHPGPSFVHHFYILPHPAMATRGSPVCSSTFLPKPFHNLRTGSKILLFQNRHLKTPGPTGRVRGATAATPLLFSTRIVCSSVSCIQFCEKVPQARLSALKEESESNWPETSANLTVLENFTCLRKEKKDVLHNLLLQRSWDGH